MPHCEERHRKSFCIELSSYRRFPAVPTLPNREDNSPRMYRRVSDAQLESEFPIIGTDSYPDDNTDCQSTLEGRFTVVSPAREKTQYTVADAKRELGM
jgi:hypothetical protein